MIEVSKASFYYPNTDEGALNDVSLQIIPENAWCYAEKVVAEKLL